MFSTSVHAAEPSIGGGDIISTEVTDVITFEEFYERLQFEYDSLNMELYIENPNYDYDYTEEYLKEQIDFANDFSESLNRIELDDSIEYSESIEATNLSRAYMPSNFSFSESYVIRPNIAAGTASVSVYVSGVFDAQYGTIMSYSGVARDMGGINIKSTDYKLQYRTSNGNKRLDITLSGSASFEYKDPKTGMTFTSTAYGPWMMWGITPGY